MAVSKVVYNQKTLIDLTSDTVVPEALLKGFTAHKADGTIVTGTMFNGYPNRYSLYDPLQDSSERNITDGVQNVIQGKTVYQKV